MVVIGDFDILEEYVRIMGQLMNMDEDGVSDIEEMAWNRVN